uniref:(northern house mosquito) hypothetical protein n=1 Tax=Culex pipiens TaxID=7175 RepID=A0A8D8FXH3_CULPI
MLLSNELCSIHCLVFCCLASFSSSVKAADPVAGFSFSSNGIVDDVSSDFTDFMSHKSITSQFVSMMFQAFDLKYCRSQTISTALVNYHCNDAKTNIVPHSISATRDV